MRINSITQNGYKPNFQRAIISNDRVTKATLTAIFEKNNAAYGQFSSFMTDLDLNTGDRDALVTVSEGPFPESSSDVYTFDVKTESGKESIEVQKKDIGTEKFVDKLSELVSKVKGLLDEYRPSEAKLKVNLLYQVWGIKPLTGDEYESFKKTDTMVHNIYNG